MVFENSCELGIIGFLVSKVQEQPGIGEMELPYDIVFAVVVESLAVRQVVGSQVVGDNIVYSRGEVLQVKGVVREVKSEVLSHPGVHFVIIDIQVLNKLIVLASF
jgi:hypothetical protein